MGGLVEMGGRRKAGEEGDVPAQRISDEPYTDDAEEPGARQQASGGQNAAVVNGERQNAWEE